MYMNGCGPMMGGHKGPMGGPDMGSRPRMGYVPGMGFRPMRVHRSPMGFFPVGALFLLPALMFGGWMVLAVLGGILGLAGMVIGGVFAGLEALAEGVFSGGGLAAGVVLGLALFFILKRRNEARKGEPAGTVDGEEVETGMEEPVHDTYRNG